MNFVVMTILRERWPVGSKSRHRAVAERVGAAYHRGTVRASMLDDLSDEAALKQSETAQLMISLSRFRRDQNATRAAARSRRLSGRASRVSFRQLREVLEICEGVGIRQCLGILHRPTMNDVADCQFGDLSRSCARDVGDSNHMARHMARCGAAADTRFDGGGQGSSRLAPAAIFTNRMTRTSLSQFWPTTSASSISAKDPAGRFPLFRYVPRPG